MKCLWCHKNMEKIKISSNHIMYRCLCKNYPITRCKSHFIYDKLHSFNIFLLYTNDFFKDYFYISSVVSSQSSYLNSEKLDFYVKEQDMAKILQKFIKMRVFS